MAIDSRQGAKERSEMWRSKGRLSEYKEKSITWLLRACAYVSILTTAGIVFVLVYEGEEFFRRGSQELTQSRGETVTPFDLLWEFLTGTTWSVGFARDAYGVLPLVSATLLITGIAIAVAVPLGLGAAIFLSEYAPSRLRKVLKPILEILAGVPTVVYGYFALTFVTPLLRGDVFPWFDPIPGELNTFNALSAGLVMGVMIIPTVASVSEDSIFAVPRSLREGAYALGATKFETVTRVVFPAALSGITAAFILGISRAIGETMIVAVAAGFVANMSADPRESMMTMTAYIVNKTYGGETPVGTVEYQTIFAVGLVLFVITLILNIASNFFVRRFSEGGY